MRRKRQRGWHKEDIRAEIRKTGVTLTELALNNGMEQSAVRVALCRPHFAAEQLIAKHLGRKPQDLWPDRYEADGTPKHPRSRRKYSGQPPAGHRQNRKAA